MTRSRYTRKDDPRRRKGENSRHDHGYKLLFSHPLLVEQLLRGFLPGSWADRLDFSTLERVSGSVVTDDLRERHDDVIWKVRWKDGEEEHWFWIYLLLELQSTPDRFMAVRLLTYVGLLLQELIREGRLEPGSLLPPVLPFVFYHGKPRWRVSLDLVSLFTAVPPDVKRYLPRLRYRLLDAGRFPLHPPELRDNLVAVLLQLETAEAREAVRLLQDLNVLVPSEERQLRRIFSIWLTRLFRKFPFGATIAKGKINLESAPMLEQTFLEWEQKIRRQERQEGRREAQLEMQKLVLEMLRQRFGPVSQAVRLRVQEIASLSELRKLAKRILTASSLEKTGLL